MGVKREGGKPVAAEALAATDLRKLDITALDGVGPKRAKLLADRLGIRSVHDAIYYFPYRYEDRRNTLKIHDAKPGVMCTITGVVVAADLIDLARGGAKVTGQTAYKRGRGRLLFELTVSDGSGIIKAKWFNQPFMKQRFRLGQNVRLSAIVKPPRWGNMAEMDNPEYEVMGSGSDEAESVHTARAVPVYRATEDVTPRYIRQVVHGALKSYAGKLIEMLPEETLRRHGLPPLTESVMNVHFPPDDANIDALNNWATHWQRRLSFQELLMLEAGFAVLSRNQSKRKGIAFKPKGALMARLIKALSFELTSAQRRVIGQIESDMRRESPMHRLVQGDVGSGKTVVALAAMLSAVECGYQAALMAPTEILAEQHYINIHKLVEGLGLRVALLTGSAKNRPMQEIESGEIHIVVGTHALIQEGVKFKALGLAVIDEQHRFGVAQRSDLRRKSGEPDVLIMTATPIPRTLAMTVYGDLDYSVIDELPPGRSPVLTTLHGEADKSTVYKAIEEEARSGGQVYLVYPLVEESDKSDLHDATKGAEALSQRFTQMRVGLIHGRMRPQEKEDVMSGFKSGKIDILVSTTVIEVGVDVPNASLMVIVHAERFGLSQLHQLRGRVGRGRRQSRCMMLTYGAQSEEAARRLNVMCATGDGFKVAEEDLAIRGPGELLGTRQSGMPDFRVADIIRDAALFEPARQEAFGLIESDPELDRWPALKAEVERFWRGRVEIFQTG